MQGTAVALLLVRDLNQQTVGYKGISLTIRPPPAMPVTRGYTTLLYITYSVEVLRLFTRWFVKCLL